MENNNELTFEAALSRLEAIVKQLESGGAPLENSLALFEEGTKLVRFCTDKIDAAEQKVKILVAGGTEEDFK